MANWQAPIPQPSKQRIKKRCYYYTSPGGYEKSSCGIAWLTDSELSRYLLEDYQFDEILERDVLNKLKKYKDCTIEQTPNWILV